MRTRGMALIVTLLMTVVLMMVIGATLKLVPTALLSSAATSDVVHANLAVEAGVNYARSRLLEDLTWRGGAGPSPTVTVRTADGSMTVVEDRGNVVGLMRMGPSQFAQFRIRFNFQDGPAGPDLLDDPSNDYRLDFPLISTNNLLGGTPLTLKEDQGGLLDSQAQVSPFQAYVAIEGRAGPAFRDADLNNPNAAPAPRRIVRRVVEARLQGASSSNLDSAAMAAGDLVVALTPPDPEPREPAYQKPRRLEVAAGWEKDAVPPRVRSKGTVSVTSPQSGLNFYSKDGYVDSGDGTLSASTVANAEVTVSQEQSGAPFYQMAWGDLHHADPDPASTEAVSLKAGTYVVWDDLTLHYYDKSFDQYQTDIKANPSDPGTVLTENLEKARNNFKQVGGNAIKFHLTNNPDSSLEVQLLVDRDVSIAPTNFTSDFTFISKRGPISGPPDSNGVVPGLVDPDSRMSGDKIQFQFTDSPTEQRTLSAQGEVLLGSRIWGNGGSITAGGDITLNGSGNLAGSEVADEADGLSLYSKGDITLRSFKPGWKDSSGRYGDISLHGVLYAWGDITAELGPPPSDPTPLSYYSHFGYFRNRGAMVAYGGDPANSVDPTSGKGNILVRAAWGKLTYDPKFLGALENSAAPGSLDVVSWLVRD